MINSQLRPNRSTKRCPKCRSNNIYKRVRDSDSIKRSKGKSKILVKTYICRSCRHEFDVPFIGTQDDLKEKKRATKAQLDYTKADNSSR